MYLFSTVLAQFFYSQTDGETVQPLDTGTAHVYTWSLLFRETWSTRSSCIPMDESCWFTCVIACCACWTWGAILSCSATWVHPTSKSTSGALSAPAVALSSRAQRMVMRTCGTLKQVNLVEPVLTEKKLELPNPSTTLEASFLWRWYPPIKQSSAAPLEQIILWGAFRMKSFSCEHSYQ